MKNHRKKPSFEGNVYVLTNVGTFSAAKDFTMMISDNDLGKVIGEASGNLPDTYGDCLVFVTPNTKLSFNISYKRWYRIDRTKAGQRIMPDYPCDPADALDKLFELTTNGD